LKQIQNQNIETTKQSQVSPNPKQFDLTIAYLLLIGAYIRSTGNVQQEDHQIGNQMKSTKQS
jgi:hypothetical protein